MEHTDFKETPEEYVRRMLKGDYFSKWMNIDVIIVEKGYCKLRYELRKEMLNGFSTAHGGALFSASDSAFAFASNSYGNASVALNVSISFVKPARAGDILTVEALEEYKGNRTALYRVTTVNQNKEKICVFSGTVYRTGKEIPLPIPNDND